MPSNKRTRNEEEERTLRPQPPAFPARVESSSEESYSPNISEPGSVDPEEWFYRTLELAEKERERADYAERQNQKLLRDSSAALQKEKEISRAQLAEKNDEIKNVRGRIQVQKLLIADLRLRLREAQSRAEELEGELSVLKMRNECPPRRFF